MCEAIVTTMMLGASAAQTLLGAAQQAQQAQEAAAQQASRAWQTAYQTAYQTAQARNAATVSEYNAQDAERRGATWQFSRLVDARAALAELLRVQG